MVQMNDVKMVYGNTEAAALNGISFTINEGEFVFLVGPSGSGKTTIIKLITGELSPTTGQITVNGFDMQGIKRRKLPKLRRTLGVIFQDFRLIDKMTVYENVAFAMRVVGASNKEIRRRVPQVLELVGLADREKRFPAELSGGEQQRVALARALILKPKVLLFDEPLSNLDANLRRSMRDKIRELQKQFDITSLYVTHDQSEAFAVSDTVLVMNKGHIMQIGSPQDLYRQPASRFMASFMGDANLFPATFSDGYVDIYGYHLPRPLHFGTQGEGMVGVRPEAITLSDRGEESQRCVIRHVAYMGPQYEVTVEWHGQEILLQVNATRLQPDVGEQYYLEIHPYGMFVLADAA